MKNLQDEYDWIQKQNLESFKGKWIAVINKKVVGSGLYADDLIKERGSTRDVRSRRLSRDTDIHGLSRRYKGNRTNPEIQNQTVIQLPSYSSI
jgi:hypothetical protein